MEALLSFCFVSLTTLVALWLIKFSGHKRNSQKQLRPPGPWNLPIVGSLHHVYSVIPHLKITALCRRHGPVMLLKLGNVPAVVVSSTEGVEQVMKKDGLMFAARPSTPMSEITGCGGRGILFAPYGDHWRQMRKVCAVELLSSIQLRRMESIRPGEVGNLLRYIAAAASAGATINLSKKALSLSNNVVSRSVFGGKFVQQEEYIREQGVVTTVMGGLCLPELFPSSRLAMWLSSGRRRLERSYAHMQRIIGTVVDERKAARDAGDGACITGDEDLLDVLLRLQSDSLTKESICTVLLDIFTAGTDTTGAALEWAMSELVRHPDVMEKAQLEIQEVLGEDRAVITHRDLAGLQYLRMVVMEVLRLHPSVPVIPRMTREDCKILGYDMLKGTTIFVNIHAVLRDPQYWKNPEEFMPERFENSNMDYTGTHFEFTPFGAGRRMCPGVIFTKSTLEIALANLLYHFNWVLPGGASPKSLDMSENFRLSVFRRYDLELVAIPRGHFNSCKNI